MESYISKLMMDNLQKEAGALFKAGKYAEAIPKAQQVLKLKEKALGSDHPDIVTFIDNLARLYYETGRYTEAEALYKRIVAITDDALGPDHPNTAVGLHHLALFYHKTDRYAEAEPLYKRSLAIMEKAEGPDHPDTAQFLISLAGLYESTSRYAEAEPLFNRSLAIDKKAYGPDHRKVATDLHNLAHLYFSSGRFEEAEPLYKRGLAITEKAKGPDHPDTATFINNLALFYEDTGRYAEAEPLFKRSLAVTEKAKGPDHPDTATSINNLAKFYLVTGRYAETEPLFKRSLAITEKAKGPDNPDNYIFINNLAGLYSKIDRYAEAEQLYKRSLAITEKAKGPDHPLTSLLLGNLAELYEKAGRYADAEPLYKRSLAIREKILGQEHPNTAGALYNLAEIYKQTGRYAEAEPLYKSSLATLQRTNVPDTFYRALGGYSGLLNKQHNPEAAVFYGKLSVNGFQKLRSNVAGLGKETLSAYTKKVEDHYKNLANLLTSLGRTTEAKQVLAMLKSEEYYQYTRRDSNQAVHATFVSFTGAEKPWSIEYDKISGSMASNGKKLIELREKNKKGVLTGDEKDQLKDAEDTDKELTASFNDLVERLQASMKEETKKYASETAEEKSSRLEKLAEENPDTLAIKNTLKSLGEGAVLLHYLIVEDRLHIIMTTQDRLLARHFDIKDKDLNAKIFSFRDTLKEPSLDPLPLAKEMHSILIGPIEKDLKEAGAKTLMLSLDGALRYLPFAALHDGNSYLIKTYQTVMYPEVAKDKVAMPAKESWQVAALGVSKPHPGFDSLPAVPSELASIVKKGSAGVVPGEMYLDQEFTKDRLKETSNRNPVMHIASHFKFSPGTETDSFLLLGDGSHMSLDQVRKGNFFKENELVTLSACETAVGSDGKGIEIESFGALVMNQGAKSVIATLWPVADDGTSQIMADFYKHKEKDKLTKVESLRQAQLAMLEGKLKPLQKDEKRSAIVKINSAAKDSKSSASAPKFKPDPQAPYSHPFFWAPFIMIGNWR